MQKPKQRQKQTDTDRNENREVIEDTYSLGIQINKELTIEHPFHNICKMIFIQRRCISSIRHILTSDPTTQRVTTLILSYLVYYNSHLVGLSRRLIRKVQHVQNCAARLTARAPPRSPNPLLRQRLCLSEDCLQTGLSLLPGDQYFRFLLFVRVSAPEPFFDIPSFLCKFASHRHPSVWVRVQR